MTEAADCRQIDLVSLLFGEVAEVCYENIRKASVTELFTLHVDPVNKMFKRKSDSGWMKQELLNLQGHNNKFGENGKQAFDAADAFCIGTSKWHALSHVVNTIRQVVSI